jgi:transcriptional regulator with GAF, ATPase, and Fis domain
MHAGYPTAVPGSFGRQPRHRESFATPNPRRSQNPKESHLPDPLVAELEDVPKEDFAGIVGSSAPLLETLDLVRIVAPTDATVLIEGETGTGKELIARAVHNNSSRRGGPFVKLNCAAIPFDLLESELFGHEKGAFTGAATQKLGRFELAHQGTLFLDEVGDIPLGLQPKLLRVLQEREFERLGSGQTHRVDVRVIAATHRDLAGLVKQNEFRGDLYYRLNIFPVVVPPLRDRDQDIPELVSHFVETFARRMGKEITHISPEIIEALTLHSWPGNVRELQNLIERAVILAKQGVLPNPLPPAKVQHASSDLAATTLRGSERALLLRTLESLGWLIGGPRGAAARLGLKRTTLISKMKKYGICRPKWPRQECYAFAGDDPREHTFVGSRFHSSNLLGADSVSNKQQEGVL